MTLANWPIRVGGIYPLTGRDPLALRVRALDGDTVYYIHHAMKSEGLFDKGGEFGEGQAPAFCFREQCQPEDQSVFPELLEALKLLVSELPSKRDWLDPAVEQLARTAIAKAEVSAILDFAGKCALVALVAFIILGVAL